MIRRNTLSAECAWYCIRFALTRSGKVADVSGNLRVLTVADSRCSGYFGFTDEEVRHFLEYYDLSDVYDRVREWYDGYRFGDKEIYCPWDVINYVDLLRADPGAVPEDFWANSSGNDAVREFVNRLDVSVTAKEPEELVAGVPVRKEIRQEITCREMYETTENLWSLLHMTGYLTGERERTGGCSVWRFPTWRFVTFSRHRFWICSRSRCLRTGGMMREFCAALRAGDAAKAEELFGQYLRKTVSIRDTFARRNLKENSYHGLLLGILSIKGNWTVTGNYETGDGCGDILIETEDNGTEEETRIVIEVKYARSADLESAVREALRQIEDRRYAEKLQDDGIEKVLKYGIACYKTDIVASVPLTTDPAVLEVRTKWTGEEHEQDFLQLPPITLTPEESQQQAELLTQVNTYADEMKLKFITGEAALDDASFDAFVAEANNRGLADAIAIEQAALDRCLAE